MDINICHFCRSKIKHQPNTRYGQNDKCEEACTRCALCVDRCPTGVISLGKFAGSLADAAIKNGVYESPWDEDSGERSDRHGYIYGRL